LAKFRHLSENLIQFLLTKNTARGQHARLYQRQVNVAEPALTEQFPDAAMLLA
jgi:hypothetical protein